jgi:dUTPase
MNTFYPTIPTVPSDGTEMPRYVHNGDAAVDLVATEDVTKWE